jgi:hypothetical protein
MLLIIKSPEGRNKANSSQDPEIEILQYCLAES